MIDKYGKILQPTDTGNTATIRIISYKNQPKLVEFRKKIDTSKNQKPNLEYKEQLIDLFNLNRQKVLTLKERQIKSTRFSKANVFSLIYCYSNFFVVQESTVRDGQAYNVNARRETITTRVFDYNGKLINKHDHKWYDTNAVIEYFERQVQKQGSYKTLGEE